MACPNPKITVIIPSFDGSRGGNVDKLKKDLEDQTIKPYEIVVVIGVSPNGKARNVGIERAKKNTDFYVFIDDDVTLGHERILENLIAPFSENSQIPVGMTGPSQLIPEDSTWVQRTASKQIPRSIFPVQKELVDSDMVSHMCLCMPAKLFCDLGMENQEIISGTDPDLRYRVRKAGYRVCVVPDSWAYHPMPVTFFKILKLAFVKGKNSAIVRNEYPDMVFDLDGGFDTGFKEKRSFPFRVFRMFVMLIMSILTLKWFFSAHLVCYSIGNLAVTLKNRLNKNSKRVSLFLWVLIVSFLFAFFLYFSLNDSIGVSSDSVVYLNVAGNIAENNQIINTAYGVNQPLTHFPPFYPLFLGFLSKIFHVNVGVSAVLCGVILFSLNILLLGWFLNISLKLKPVILIIPLIILSVSEYMLYIHSMAYSESLFFLFQILMLIYLQAFFRSHRYYILLISGLLASFACLTRYAGISLIGVGIISLCIIGKRSWLKRLYDVLIFFIFSAIPLSIWIFRNLFLAGTCTNRKISLHIISMAHIRQLFRSLLYIVFPDTIIEKLKNFGDVPCFKYVLFFSLLLLSIILVVILLKSKSGIIKIWKNQSNASLLLILFLFIYPAFLMLSISLFDFNTPLSYRIMFPWVMSFFLFSTIQLVPYIISKKGKLKICICFILLIFSVSYLIRGTLFLYNLKNNGLGYSGRIWQDSKILNFVKKLPQHPTIYSNGMQILFYHLDYLARPLPYKIINGKLNPEYSSEINNLKKSLADSGALVIYFFDIPSTRLSTPEELENELDLKKVLETDQGVVFSL